MQKKLYFEIAMNYYMTVECSTKKIIVIVEKKRQKNRAKRFQSVPSKKKNDYIVKVI